MLLGAHLGHDPVDTQMAVICLNCRRSDESDPDQQKPRKLPPSRDRDPKCITEENLGKDNEYKTSPAGRRRSPQAVSSQPLHSSTGRAAARPYCKKILDFIPNPRLPRSGDPLDSRLNRSGKGCFVDLDKLHAKGRLVSFASSSRAAASRWPKPGALSAALRMMSCCSGVRAQ